MKKDWKRLVAIPSYSEVLFLHADDDYLIINGEVAIPSYSEVLFLLTQDDIEYADDDCRNPFLFRGPIPTLHIFATGDLKDQVAIPSYSEVLFLLGTPKKSSSAMLSQSLLIQRSYSYCELL